MPSRSNALLFWPVLALVALIDVATKAIAVRELVQQRVPHELFGNAVRFTLVYNPGAAFGLHVGPQSRWIFTVLTVIALVILGRLYLATRTGDTPRVVALAFVCAGAIGNLLDRLRSDLGVIDFLDVGFGDSRWPTFNVADMAVSTGAVLLAWVLWQEDRDIASAGVSSQGVPLAGVAPSDRGDLV